MTETNRRGNAPSYRLRPGQPPPPRRAPLARTRVALAIGGAISITAASGLAGGGGLGLLQGSDKPRAEDWRAQQSPNVQASARLLTVIGDQRGEAPLARAVVLAEAATNEQARLGGATLNSPIGLPQHLTPSSGVAELLDRHQIAPSPAQQAAITALDGLAEPLAPAVTRMINAHLAFEYAAFEAFAYADLSYLAAAADANPTIIDGQPPPSTAAGTPPLATLRNAGIDVGPVMAARRVMLEAAVYLQWAWLVTTPAARTPVANTAPSPAPATVATADCPAEPAVTVPPVVAIDVVGGANCYDQDYTLVIDLDGVDTYHAEAGTVLIDVGEDDDQHLSQNGGGNRSAGFLLDDGGNDTYAAGPGGTNGGANTGIGFLVDAGDGDDIYAAGGGATNGGALSGAGTLVDAGGDDTYSAGDDGTNGGASVSLGLPASGFLVDAGGNDRYEGGGKGTNGGSSSGSLGYLLDAGAGKDSYTAEGVASNGSGLFGIGFLYDVGGGGDSYTVNTPPNVASNGAGGDTTGGRAGAGGPSPAPGAGLLLDGGGLSDTYRDGYADATGTDVSRIPKGSVGAQVDLCSRPGEAMAVDNLLTGVCQG